MMEIPCIYGYKNHVSVDPSWEPILQPHEISHGVFPETPRQGMVRELLTSRPSDPFSFMMGYIQAGHRKVERKGGMIGRDVPPIPRWAPKKGNPFKRTPYIMWVFTGYNYPQEFLEKAINTMSNCHLKRGGLETWQKIVVVRRCCGELLGGYGRNKGRVCFVLHVQPSIKGNT